MCSVISCELCNQIKGRDEVSVYRLKDGRLYRTDDQDWFAKSGSRHVCHDCAAQVADAVACK